MKMQQVVLAGLLALGIPMSVVWAGAGHQGSPISGRLEAKESDGHAHTHDDEMSSAGRVGISTNVSRSIKIIALDTMRYDKNTFEVKSGETVRFVVTNAGKQRHEFVLGTRAEQREHAEMMAAMPDMQHNDGASLDLAPGVTGELIWQFAKAGTVEIACHTPGHFEAGMKAKVLVKD